MEFGSVNPHPHPYPDPAQVADAFEHGSPLPREAEPKVGPTLTPTPPPVQLTVPTGDDGQLMSSASSAWPVLWLSTNAVQLAVPIGDDGQLMSLRLRWPAHPMT